MLIGNTILGLAKITRLMRLSLAQKTQAAARANTSDKTLVEMLGALRMKKPAKTGKIRLHDSEFPVPNALVLNLFIKSRNDIQTANSNSVKQALAAEKIAQEKSFANRVATQKATNTIHTH